MNIVLQRTPLVPAESADTKLRAESAATTMPDIANAPHAGAQGTLDWVGMGAVHTPVLLDEASHATAAAEVQIYVDLADAEAKGIHMSRLYLALDAFVERQAISPASVSGLLNDMLASHADLSTSAGIEFRFAYQRKQPALLSDNSGWQSYPVKLTSKLVNGETITDLSVTVTYSSTCPCSAALARQLIAEAFKEQFSDRASIDISEAEAFLRTEQGINATPHSQRSTAAVTVRLSELGYQADMRPLLDTLIDQLEAALGTPVQTAVKREDEQEFARLNGENLMFCEDAARKLKNVLDSDPLAADFKLRIDHYESLHAHNAVAMASKGVAGGFSSEL